MESFDTNCKILDFYSQWWIIVVLFMFVQSWVSPIMATDYMNEWIKTDLMSKFGLFRLSWFQLIHM